MNRTARDYRDLEKRHPVDETTKPKWATAPDGRYTDISSDIRFGQLFTEWFNDACQHERTGIIRWVNDGSQTCYNWFCAHCGHKLGSNIPHALALVHGAIDGNEANLDAMASRSRAYVAERERRLEKLKSEAAYRAQPENRGTYDDYLRSEAWQRLRTKILKRAQGLCEGCLEAAPEHIHHISYAHKGEEFAFELIALCSACHRRVHQAAE